LLFCLILSYFTYFLQRKKGFLSDNVEENSTKSKDWGVFVNHCKSPLLIEIEKLRMELCKGSDLMEQIQDMDSETFALSLKLDKLIVEYMKSKENL
jgi:CRISPR/Cas system CMR-associated protein Cmr5 small subunit